LKKKQEIAFYNPAGGKEYEGTKFPFPDTFVDGLSSCMKLDYIEKGKHKAEKFDFMTDFFKALGHEYACKCGKVWVRKNTASNVKKCVEKIIVQLK